MKESQKIAILNCLMTGTRLTGLDALKYFGCLNLRNRVCEIEKDGFTVDREMVGVKTKYGVKRVMVYWMNPTPKEKELHNEMLFI